MTIHILLIENNNLAQAESLLPHLTDYQVTMAHTPELATSQTEALWPNLVICNPVNNRVKISSFQKAVNKVELNIPFIVVGDELPTVNTDTIFIAPNNPQQLTQGLKKVATRQQARFIRLPKLTIDCQQYQLLHNNQRYHLTPKEFRLLELLVEHRDQDLSRRAIMKEVWETDYMGDTRTLDVHIRWLREKIEEPPGRPRRLLTIRGVGYRFITNPE